MKRLVLLAVACAVGSCAFADDVPASSLGRGCWTLSPEAEKIVAEMRETANGYSPHTDHIMLFPRSQVKYGLEANDYLHRWYDRPLQQDSSLRAFSEKGRMLNPKSWPITASTVRLGKMDGMAVCVSQSGRRDIVPRSVMPGGELPILVELPYGYHENGMESYVKAARTAIEMPNAFRIDGKIVLTRYPEIKPKDLEFYVKLRDRLISEFGDRFILLPYLRLFENVDLPESPLKPENIEHTREKLRTVLRKADGFFYCGRDAFDDRRYNPKFADEVMTPLIQSVFVEPEFKGKKYLGTWVTPGHENTYRWQYVLDSTGTRMYRDIMGAVRNLRPDFCILCEWDEENENTCFRPTFANGMTAQRLTRYFADEFAGRPVGVFPGDITNRPNLVVSYRKSLVAGEPLEVEVLNIPDGTFAGETFNVEFSWCDTEGRIVRNFLRKKLRADGLDAVWFTVPVSELVGERTLVPRLNIAWSGGATTVADGFWPVSLEATRNVDHKWVKHALREMAVGVNGELTLSPRKSDGTYEVSARVSSLERMRSIEVLEGSDTVYMFNPTNADVRGRTVIKMQYQGLDCAAGNYRLNGRITWTGGGMVEVRNVPLGNWFGLHYAEFAADDVDDAVIEVDLAPVFKGKVKVSEVLKHESVSIPGIAGGNFVLTRFLSVRSIPDPAFVNEAKFALDFKPVRKSDVLAIQVCDENFRLWRSRPLVCEEKTGRLVTMRVHEREGANTSKILLDSVRIEEPEYDFTDTSHGAVVPCRTEGRALWGILGGKASLVTGFGMGETQYGNQIARYIRTTMDGWEHVQPDYTVEGLHFSKCAFVGLPQQIVPGFASFEMEMRVKPEACGRTMHLFSSGDEALQLWLEQDGTPVARFFGGRKYVVASPRGTKLTFGEWNTVRLVRDGDNVWVETNGEKGAPVRWSNYFHNSRWTTIGASKAWDFFRGEISMLKVAIR